MRVFEPIPRVGEPGTLRGIAHPIGSLWIRRPFALGRWPSAVYPAALALALLLPFAAIPPILLTPWAALTDDKLVFLVLVATWLWPGRRALPTASEWRALLPSLVFILVVLLSARLAAPEYADEALRFVSRLGAAVFAMLVALRLGRTPRHTTGILWALAIGGGLSALLGIGEAVRWPPLQPVLALFKVAPTRVGGELRVGASFQYATIAAMYFEMIAPIAIVLAATARRRRTQVLATAIAVVCTANVVLSLTRAGVLTLGAVCVVLLLAAIARPSCRRLLAPTLISAAVLVGGVALLLWRDPVFNLRLVTESDADWYGASYSAPAALDLEANRTATVELEVQNQGRIPWATDGAHPFALGYRWLTSDGNGVLDVAPAEVPLPREVQPGETIHLQALVSVPDLPAGSYRLDWGMLQRDVLQFYERGWADAETTVRIQPGTGASSVAMPAVLSRDDGEAPWVVGRLDLWSVALRLFASHPLLGVGPDNFRHYYGAELGLEGWDERIQANNLYLEILADLGVLGLASFAWVVLGPLRGLWRAFMRGGFEGLAGAPMSLEGTAQTSLEREAEGREGTRLTSLSREAELAPAAQLGVALALGAFLLHGLLDSFLAFTPTAVVFWLLLGLAQAQKPHVSGR